MARTFRGAFRLALVEAGFREQKVNEILSVWKHRDFPGRRDMPQAVIAAVRGRRGEEASTQTQRVSHHRDA